MLSEPRLHPNGFIQVNINDFRRINIWDESLPPAQTINTPIHDHTFDFTSRIVAGTLIHIAYDFTQDQKGDFELWGVQPWLDGEETQLKKLPGMRGNLSEFESLRLPAGYQYQFHAGWFHETKHEGFTVTVMTKTRKNVTAGARVAVPQGGSVDNTFVRDIEQVHLLLPYVHKALVYLDADTLGETLDA
jgi:hypothetical protein